MEFSSRPKSFALNRRLKLSLLAALPLLFAIVSVAWIVQAQFDKLAVVQITAVEPVLLQARKDEIRHFVQAGRRAVADLVKRNGDGPQTRREAREMLRSMDFGADNYFFIYDIQGNGVMHPRLPAMESSNYWNLKDENGVLIIQRLIQQASHGGGFVEFVWHRPSTGLNEKKIGYAEIIPDWGWMIGSGLYLDAQQETESRLREAIVNVDKATQAQILLVSCAAILMVFAGVFTLNVYEQRKADSKVRLLAQEVVRSQELERTRVARELHDGVSQSLTSVKFILECGDIHLDRGRADAASAALKTGIGQLITTMVDVRRMSHDLYPTILDDGGLGVAIEQLAREFTNRTHATIDIQIDPLPDLKREIAWALYRFAQQAMANIEAHASASAVKISLRLSNGIHLKVGDDGAGFDVPGTMQRRRSGLGLTSMRERIEMLGGDFEIHSRPGMTVLGAYLPSESLKAS